MFHKRKRTVTLLIGTTRKVYLAMLNRDFNPIVWASENLETAAHYFEGCMVEIKVTCDPKQEMRYLATRADSPVSLPEYTWGRAEVVYPKGAIWYSFSRNYLLNNLVSIREVFPDISKFNYDD